MTENSNIVQTDSDGKATFIPQDFRTVGTTTITATEMASGISASTEVEVVDIDRIDMAASAEVVSEGTNSIITATPYSNDVAIPNMLIHINGEECVTNSNGEATYIYQGESIGQKAIIANCGDFLWAIGIIDAYQYFSQSKNKEYNFLYVPVNSLSVTRKYNGLELANSPNAEGSFRLVYGDYLIEQWQFEFKVVSVSKNLSIEVCGHTVSYDLLKELPLIQVFVYYQNNQYHMNIFHKNLIKGTTRAICTDADVQTPFIKLIGGSIAGNFAGSIIIDDIVLTKVGE